MSADSKHCRTETMEVMPADFYAANCANCIALTPDSTRRHKDRTVTCGCELQNTIARGDVSGALAIAQGIECRVGRKLECDPMQHVDEIRRQVELVIESTKEAFIGDETSPRGVRKLIQLGSILESPFKEKK